MRIRLAACLLLLTTLFAVQFPATAQSAATASVNIQNFEKGLMLYHGETGNIWVLSNNGIARLFPSSSYGALQFNPIYGTPPTRLRPIMGFGQVWGNFADVRTALGWPTSEESSQQATLSLTSGTYRFQFTPNSAILIYGTGRWTRSLSEPTPGAPVVTPIIRQFIVTPSPATIHQEITISWDVGNVNYVAFELLDWNYDRKLWITDLGPTGTRPIPAPALGGLYTLRFYGYNHPASLTSITPLIEQESQIFIQDTPISTIETYAAYQDYFGGFMIWRSDTSEVMVLNSTAGVLYFPLASYANLPDNPITQYEPGSIPPVNAFGRVWGNNEYVRQLLNTPRYREVGYTLRVQQVGVSEVHYSLPGGQTLVVSNLSDWVVID